MSYIDSRVVTFEFGNGNKLSVHESNGEVVLEAYSEDWGNSTFFTLDNADIEDLVEALHQANGDL